MKESKRRKLEAAGWKVDSADEFLGLSEDESREVESRRRDREPLIVRTPTLLSVVDDQLPKTSRPSPRADGLRIPDGWTLELLPSSKDQMLLETPPPKYMATIDFKLRGFRSGYVQSGRFVGEKLTKRGYTERKKYEGRGWKQTLVDDAIAHLREVLK